MFWKDFASYKIMLSRAVRALCAREKLINAADCEKPNFKILMLGWKPSLLGAKGIATSNKCLTSSNKKLVETRALLVVTMFATRNKCIATRSTIARY